MIAKITRRKFVQNATAIAGGILASHWAGCTGVVIDVDSLLLARDMGWTGAVVKSPKGLSHMILMASIAGQKKIFLAGGDMSCPGAALIQTANLQARVPTITSLEANARQYLPQANKAWESRFPGMFHVTDGLLRTREAGGPGLGAPES